MLIFKKIIYIFFIIENNNDLVTNTSVEPYKNPMHTTNL